MMVKLKQSEARDQSKKGRWRRARNPADIGSSAGLGSGFTKTVIVVAATAISNAVPKNGARQEMVPNDPPTNGPRAIPMPSAASYKMMAAFDPPLAAPTIPAYDIVKMMAFLITIPSRIYKIRTA